MNGHCCFALTDNINPQTTRNNCIHLTQRHLMKITECRTLYKICNGPILKVYKVLLPVLEKFTFFLKRIRKK